MRTVTKNGLGNNQSEAKAQKYLGNPYLGKKLKMTWRTWLFTLTQIATHMMDSKTPTMREKVRCGIALLNEDGYIDESIIVKAKEKLIKKGANGIWKDGEIISEIIGLVDKFNNPEVYGYSMAAFVDAKAQNWSIFAAMFVRSKRLMKKLNFNIDDDRHWADIPMADFNTANLEAFLEYFKDDIADEDKHRVSRNVTKFLAMVMGYGSRVDTAILKAIAETDAKDRAYITALLERVKDRIEGFLNETIVGFADYSRFFRGVLARDIKHQRYDFDILGLPYSVSSLMKVSQEIEVGTVYNPDTKILRFSNDYIIDPKKERYQLSKMAYATHHLDAWLVHFTRNAVYKYHGVDIMTNHDSYGGHPEFMFDTMQFYLKGFQILAKRDILKEIVGNYGKLDGITGLEFKKLFSNIEQTEFDALWKLNPMKMLNHIWA